MGDDRPGAVPAKGLIPPNFTGYNSSVKAHEFNPGKATDLLRLAGFPQGRGLPQLTLYLPGGLGAGPWRRPIQDLAAIGIHLECIINPPATHFAGVERGEFELFRRGWIADYPDPLDFFHLFYSRSFSNQSRYRSPEYDALFEEAEREEDRQKRFELFRRMEQILYDDSPAIFYMHEVESLGINPAVRNLEASINPFRMRFYKYVWIEQ